MGKKNISNYMSDCRFISKIHKELKNYILKIFKELNTNKTNNSKVDYESEQMGHRQILTNG